MHRREILKSTASIAVGASLVASAGPAEAVGAKPVQPVKDSGPFVVTRDGVRLFYKDWGTGKPVVFMAGWALNADFWNYQLVHLSEQGLRTVAFDRRGHGRSSDPGRGFDTDTRADDVAAVLDALDLREVTLVAHSMASGELVRYLTRHGAGRIARLVFVGATTPFLLKTEDNPEAVERRFFEQTWALWRHDFPKWMSDNEKPFVTPETSPGTIEWVRAMMMQTSLKAIVECGRASVETDFRAELKRIILPTLVIHGDKDASAPIQLTGRKTAALIPGARMEVYEGAPHAIPVTHIDRLNKDLLAFARG